MINLERAAVSHRLLLQGFNNYFVFLTFHVLELSVPNNRYFCEIHCWPMTMLQSLIFSGFVLSFRSLPLLPLNFYRCCGAEKSDCLMSWPEIKAC